MALDIKYIKKESPNPPVVIEARLCISGDGKRLVPDGHPDAAFLFCTPGNEVDKAEFERYELDASVGDAIAAEEGVAAATPPSGDGEPQADAEASAEGEPEAEGEPPEDEEKPKRKARKRAADKAVKGPDGDK